MTTRRTAAQNPREVAGLYFELVHARDVDGITGLYEQGAVIDHGDSAIEPKVVVGRAAIAEFYAQVLERGPRIVDPRFFADDRHCTVQFEGQLSPDARPLEMLDIFCFGATGIARMDGYTRGAELPDAPIGASADQSSARPPPVVTWDRPGDRLDTVGTIYRYIDRIHSRDTRGVAELYAEDGIVAHANPREAPSVVVGRDAIREFYERIVSSTPVMSRFMIYADGPAGVFQFDGDMSSDVKRNEMVDVFQLGPDGLVARMDAYTRQRVGVRNGVI